MHELVIVGGIIEAITELAEKEGKRVARFTVAVGELASFDKKLIEELLNEVKKGTNLENTAVAVEVEEARVLCRSCDSELGFKDLVEPLGENEREMIHFLPELVSSFTYCPKCGGRDLEIKSGRGIRVSYIEFEK